jgi:uncharacterized protein
MKDDEFEWDDAKATANLAKHKVALTPLGGLSQTRLLLSERMVPRTIASRASTCSAWSMVGCCSLPTMRGEIIRIISARDAEPYERRLYHEEN